MSKLTNLPAVPLTKKHDTLTEEERIMTSHYADQFDEPLRTLVDIHTYCRPHNSDTIDEFVEKFLVNRFAHMAPYFLNGVNLKTMEEEPYALVIDTGHASKTLFSAHVDTVHSYSGRQIVEYDTDMALLHKPSKHRSQFGDCLGADDGAGIWLLIQMIEAGVPGVYAFHYGEERGGVGSSGIADTHPAFLQQFDRAIAFDRKGTSDVITHQGMGRCCSDKFAKALADALNNTGNKLSMAPDDGGIFTDTANYTHIIPECTNVACGYESAHTSAEFLDVEYLMKLRDALLNVEWEQLPTCRDPKDIDVIGDWGYGTYKFPTKQSYKTDPVADMTDEVMQMRFTKMVDWVKTSKAELVAEILYELVDRVYAAQEALYEAQDEAANQHAFDTDDYDNWMQDDDDPQTH